MEELDLLLIGKTGNGKSATGNSILKRKLFKSGSNTTSITKSIQVHFSKYKDCTIKVVDGPGVGDTDLSQEAATKQMTEAMAMAIAASPQGYHAFLLVVKFGGRFTKEDVQTVEVLKAIFGDDFVRKYCVLVVTYGDNFYYDDDESDCFEDWCSRQVGVFHDLLVECANRAVLFDNRTKDEETQNRQLDNLLNIVRRLSSNRKRYTNDQFDNAKKNRDRLILEHKIPAIREESMKEASLIIQELGKTNLEDPEIQLKKLETLSSRADVLIKSLIDQDNNTHALREIIQNAKHIKETVNNQIERTKTAIDIQIQRLKVQKEMEAIRQKELQLQQEKQTYERERMHDMLRDLQQKEIDNRDKIERMQKELDKDVEKVEDEHVKASSNSFWNTILSVGKFLLTTFLPPVFSLIAKKLFNI